MRIQSWADFSKSNLMGKLGTQKRTKMDLIRSLGISKPNGKWPDRVQQDIFTLFDHTFCRYYDNSNSCKTNYVS